MPDPTYTPDKGHVTSQLLSECLRDTHNPKGSMGVSRLGRLDRSSSAQRSKCLRGIGHLGVLFASSGWLLGTLLQYQSVSIGAMVMSSCWSTGNMWRCVDGSGTPLREQSSGASEDPCCFTIPSERARAHNTFYAALRNLEGYSDWENE